MILIPKMGTLSVDVTPNYIYIYLTLQPSSNENDITKEKRERKEV
jgi:hypothetical protein